ncbi:MAG: hypothetical protein EOP49_43395 [Sphingobacteriales bacterium]|nr:MAG: hypothetical protein EOP49_43395 [Sphingobacteriales bacterium]
MISEIKIGWAGLADRLGAFGGLAVILMLLLFGCGQSASIAGTYVSRESGEYSLSQDTLVIAPSGSEDNYSVVRRSAFQKVRGGKLQPEERKVFTYTGRYDSSAGLLVLDGEDKRILFFSGGLMLVKREYTKVAGEEGL